MGKDTMQITVTFITVVRTHGTDKVYLRTNLPGATYPYNGTTDVLLECAAGTAEEYCRVNFPLVACKVIDRQNLTPPFENNRMRPPTLNKKG